jgi:hypothetical protein
MQGRNSVTNEVYGLLSDGCATIYTFHPNKYTDAGVATANWFRRWLPVTGGTGLLDSNGLVLERPLGNVAYPAWCWSGDQGLFIKRFPLQPGHAGRRPGRPQRGDVDRAQRSDSRQLVSYVCRPTRQELPCRRLQEGLIDAEPRDFDCLVWIQ